METDETGIDEHEELRQLNKHSRFAGYRPHASDQQGACTHTRRARVEFRSRVKPKGGRETFGSFLNFAAFLSLRKLDARFICALNKGDDLLDFLPQSSAFNGVIPQSFPAKTNCQASVIIRARDFAICTVMRRFSLSRMIPALPFRSRSRVLHEYTKKK